jgi:hypothetical protein
MRIWSSINPHEFVQSPLHPQKIGVWLAVSRRRIFGPVFFEATINAARYRNNLLVKLFYVKHCIERKKKQNFFGF